MLNTDFNKNHSVATKNFLARCKQCRTDGLIACVLRRRAALAIKHQRGGAMPKQALHCLWILLERCEVKRMLELRIREICA